MTAKLSAHRRLKSLHPLCSLVVTKLSTQGMIVYSWQLLQTTSSEGFIILTDASRMGSCNCHVCRKYLTAAGMQLAADPVKS